MHDFLNLTCSMRYLPPHDDWCIIDDEFVPMFYNGGKRDGYEFGWTKDIVPDGAVLDATKKPVVPDEDHEHIVSKFTFHDEVDDEEYVRYSMLDIYSICKVYEYIHTHDHLHTGRIY